MHLGRGINFPQPPAYRQYACQGAGHNITIYFLQTNLDVAPEGVSYQLAKRLTDINVLAPMPGKYLKLFIYAVL